MKKVGTVILYFKKRQPDGRCICESANAAWTLAVPVNPQTQHFDGTIEIAVAAKNEAPKEIQQEAR